VHKQDLLPGSLGKKCIAEKRERGSKILLMGIYAQRSKKEEEGAIGGIGQGLNSGAKFSVRYENQGSKELDQSPVREDSPSKSNC